jgi:heavy metal translocating P-type ATPase
VQATIAHSTRGRLRVRYPVAWLRGRHGLVEAQLRRLPGVRSVEGSPVTGSVRILYDPFALAEEAIVASLQEMSRHLDAPPIEEAASEHARPRLAAAGTTANLLGTASVLATVCLPAPPLWATGLVLASGLPTLLRAGDAIVRQRRLNGDVLEASTLALLALRGHHVAGALLTTLRALGEFVVARTIVRTRRSLHEIVVPPTQTVPRVDGDARHTVPVAALTAGDVIVVTAPARIPADGTVVRGEAMVNQQTMTGEGLPVERRTGHPVFAATDVVDGEIEIRVERVGLATAVGRIVRAIDAAADEKSDIQRFAERLADREVWRTLALAGLGTLVSRSVNAGTAILVADYGTASRVGIPAAIVASIRRASGEGILIKGPRALENLARVDTVVFDKTGTLTLGAPRVSRVATYDRRNADALVALAAAAEHDLRHPVARAIARDAAARGLTVSAPRSRALTVALGVDVEVDGVRVLVGSRRFLEAVGIDLSAARRDEEAAHAAGASLTFVAADGRLAGVLVLEDELREDAPAAVRALRERRMRNVILLSGDHPEPTRVIANSLGLRTFDAELLPEDKANLVRKLRNEGRVVAMIGDGVNDALALTAADVGIAVPGGAEVTTEAADVVLLRGGLEQVVRALDLAVESIGAVRRTLRTAAQANLGVVGLASLGLAQPLASILLSHGTTVISAMATVKRLERPRAGR